MADKKEEPPSEFNQFVRELGIKAFDSLAEKASDRQTEPGSRSFKASATTAINKLAGYWTTLGTGEKEKFFDQMIAAAQVVAAGAPAMVAGFKSSKKKDKAPKKKQKKDKRDGGETSAKKKTKSAKDKAKKKSNDKS